MIRRIFLGVHIITIVLQGLFVALALLIFLNTVIELGEIPELIEEGVMVFPFPESLYYYVAQLYQISYMSFLLMILLLLTRLIYFREKFSIRFILVSLIIPISFLSIIFINSSNILYWLIG